MSGREKARKEGRKEETRKETRKDYTKKKKIKIGETITDEHTDFKDECHPYSGMEVDVTMEEPPTRIVGDKSNDGVTTVWNAHSVFPNA